MNENGKISVRQFGILAMFYSIGTTILIIPGVLAADAKQDAWIAAILGSGFGCLLVLLYTRLGNKFPQLTLVQCMEKLLGRWAGAVLSLLFVFFCFIGAATLLFYMGNFVTTQVMEETPIQFINILFFLIVVMGMRLGLETLARSAEIFFPWFVLLFAVLVLFVSPKIEVQKLQPVLETGFKPLMEASLNLAGTASFTAIVLLMVYPAFVNNPRRAGKAFLKAIIIGGIVMIMITLLSITVLGAETTARQAYPSYVLAKKIQVGNFVERIEVIVAAMWFFSIYYKMTLYFWGCVTGLAQVLRLKDYRPIILPMGMLVVVYSLVVYPNVDYMAEWDTTIFIPYVLVFGLVLPLVLLGASAFRKKT